VNATTFNVYTIDGKEWAVQAEFYSFGEDGILKFHGPERLANGHAAVKPQQFVTRNVITVKIK